MIEQAMIFALGLLTAGLFALLFLPAVWRRAMRLSRQRIERQIPLSMEEVVAERDRLRAECAVAERRIEQKAERIARTRATDLGELGRRAVRIAGLEDDLSERRAEVAELRESLQSTRRSLTETEGSLGATAKELYDTFGLLERTRRALEDLGTQHRDLGAVADEGRVTIASLQTLVEGERAKVEDLTHALEHGERMLRQAQQEMQLLANQREAAYDEVAFLQTRRSVLEARLEAQAMQLAGLADAQAAAEREREAIAAEAARHQEMLARRDATIARDAERIAELEDKLSRMLQTARTAERDMLARIDALRSEKAMLDGALEAARRERDGAAPAGRRPRSAPAAAAAPAAEGAPAAAEAAPAETDERSAALRNSMLEIAAEVRRLSGTADAAAAPRTAEIKVLRERPGREPARDSARATQPLTPPHLQTLSEPEPATQGQTARTS